MGRNYPITFRELMRRSEHVLWRTDSLPEYYKSPVSQLLDDGQQYGVWESQHSVILRQIAGVPNQSVQTIALRKAAVKMIHRRGLIDYLRLFAVRGAARADLFRAFYGPLDFREAVITEHRQYVLAASSGYCFETLVNAVNDPQGFQMLERYQLLYRDYFGIYAQFLQAERTDSPELQAALRPTMLEHRAYLDRLRRTILCSPPRWRLRPGRRLAA